MQHKARVSVRVTARVVNLQYNTASSYLPPRREITSRTLYNFCKCMPFFTINIFNCLIIMERIIKILHVINKYIFLHLTSLANDVQIALFERAIASSMQVLYNLFQVVDNPKQLKNWREIYTKFSKRETNKRLPSAGPISDPLCCAGNLFLLRMRLLRLFT